MKIDCERLQEQYSDYFEHTLAPAEVTEFETHIAACSECRADYHTFATMFQYLDRVEVAEVDAPGSLRAEILTVIAQRPAVRIFNLKDWANTVFGRPQTRWGMTLAAAACLVVAVVVGIHGKPTAQPTQTVTGNMLSGSGADVGAAIQSPLLQNVALKQGTDNLNYEVFTLHTPPNVKATANVSAYVLQNGDPIVDATQESDATKATPAWSGTLPPNVSLTLPVSVTSNVPAGTSLNLLLDWSAQDGSVGREVAFVPISPAASTPTPVSSGESFYDAIRTISGEYQATIVADNSALMAIAKFGPLSGTTGGELNAEQALNSVLSADGFTVTVQPGGYYLISHS